MQSGNVIAGLIAHSGRSARAVSAALGKSQNWATMTARPDRAPRLDTVAAVADVAGCDVCVIDRETGETVLTVEPPAR